MTGEEVIEKQKVKDRLYPYPCGYCGNPLGEDAVCCGRCGRVIDTVIANRSWVSKGGAKLIRRIMLDAVGDGYVRLVEPPDAPVKNLSWLANDLIRFILGTDTPGVYDVVLTRCRPKPEKAAKKQQGNQSHEG